MFKKLVYVFFICTLVASTPAAELPPLIDELASEDYAARYKARMDLQAMLASASAPGADPALRAALEEGVLEGLQSGTNRVSRLWLTRMLELFGTESAVDALENLLADEDVHLQDAARRALAANPGATAGKALRSALDKAPAEQKPGYIDALVYRGDADAARSIAALLKSEDPALVEKAAEALGKMNDPAFIQGLSGARDDADDALKPVIELAMLQIGITADLAGDLVRHGSRTSIRAGAFRQLAARDEKAALTVLAEILARPEFSGRTEILRAAMEAPHAVLQQTLVDRLPQADAAEQQVVLDAIADYALSNFEPEVLAVLPALTGPVQYTAVRALGIIGGPNSFQPLYDMYLKNPHEDITRTLSRLQLPEMDAQLFKALQEPGEPEKQLAAIKLLVLRNVEGTVDQMHGLAAPGQDETLRKEVFKAMESVGNLESCRMLAQAIIRQDPLMKPAQQSLKRLSQSLGTPDAVWTSVYQPALAAAPDDNAREALLVILDGAAGKKSLAYLDGLVKDPAAPLHAAALQALSRWPDFDAGEVWLSLLSAEAASTNNVEAVQKGLTRILTREEITASRGQKMELAVKAVRQGPTPAFKQAMLAGFGKSKMKPRDLKDAKKYFEPLLADPDVEVQVRALLN